MITDDDEVVYLKVSCVLTTLVEVESWLISQDGLFGELIGIVTYDKRKAHNDALLSQEILKKYLNIY